MANQVVKNIQNVYLNGKKYTIAELYVYIGGAFFYSESVSVKGWYKTSKGVLNNLTNR